MSNMANGKSGLDAFTLKTIAIIAMTCNHIARAFDGSLPLYLQIPLHIVGGLTFPIMAFLMVEGYHKTSNVKKYMLRLLLFGILAFVPFVMLFEMFTFNILFTFLLGLICLYLHDKMKNRVLYWFCFAGMVALTILCDWALVGIPMIIMYGTIKKPKLRLILTTVLTSLILILLMILTAAEWGTKLYLEIGFGIVILGAIPLIWAYNGQRGFSPRSLRYLFYIYYPIHLLVIIGIKWLMGM